MLAFFLPFTSFPLVANLSGSGMVGPLSILPLLLLLFVWLVPFFLRGGKLPPQVTPLFAFCMAALISSAAAFFIAFPPYKSMTLLNSETKSLVTLAIGLCFYLVLVTWLKDAKRLQFFLRWVNWSGVLVMGWSYFQAFIWFRYHTYPDWMWNIQGHVSNSLLLYVQRVTGFAYEPSWLAHQFNMVYLPFWLAATATGYSAHRMRLGILHFEQILLVGGIGTLVLSVSRIGLLTFIFMIAFLILLWNVQLVRWMQRRLVERFRPTGNRAVLVRQSIAVGSALILVLVYAGILLGAAFGLSRYDVRMARLFDFKTIQDQSFMHYANQLVFAERIVFWQAGWEVFNDNPILGVGLGNAGYFFPKKLSAFSFALNEVRNLIYRQTALPNIKSLWVRLLAETGIIGFAFFVGWIFLLWKSAGFLRSREDRLQKTIGLLGSFALIGFLMEGFSIDTFALPYYWISFALITAVCEQARRLVLKPEVDRSGYQAGLEEPR